ncbi:hypothetical protein HOY80DRAFT_764548 [Tuber brumale]|nr:hypothetical protein HOY80DRAFT_764548 [Tuber brumale]
MRLSSTADMPKPPEGQIGPQPGLELALQGSRDLTSEAAAVTNVPAPNGGAEIVALLQHLEQGLTALQQGQEDTLQQVQVLRDEVSRCDKNSVARAANNSVDCDSAPLEPFYGLNGKLIPRFPATLGDIKKLSSDRVDRLLLALGLDVVGTLKVRRRRLRKHIGLDCLNKVSGNLGVNWYYIGAKVFVCFVGWRIVQLMNSD